MSISALFDTQKQVHEILSCFLSRNKIPHSLLFAGPSGSGKTFFAQHLAQDLLCIQSKHGFACGECKSCRMHLSGAHPDYYYFSSQDGASIGIDTARKIQEFSSWKPAYAPRKVIHIDDIHFLTMDAFNSMLKSLEEPNASTIYLMTTSQLDSIPATILSRTVSLPFHRLSLDQIKILLNKNACNPAHIDLIVLLSQGNMKKAHELMNEEKYNEHMQWIQKLIDFIINPRSVFPSISKNDTQNCLDIFKILIKECYYMKLSSYKSSIIDMDQQLLNLISSPTAMERLLLAQEKLIQLEIDLRLTRINQKSNVDTWMIQAKQLLYCH
ncbi:MAG TPA: AAA family ATPase [Caldisericia bacterium]|nr:AAA family ATPase [Caldisericia bacterium]